MESRTAASASPPTDVIVLLDIDKTLVVYKDYTSSEKIIYTGGRQCWQEGLTAFRTAAEKSGIRVHYGLATFKKKDHFPPLISDTIYGQIMADSGWSDYCKYAFSQNDLKEFIHPKLVFFIGETLEQLSENVTMAHRSAIVAGPHQAAAYPPAIMAGKTLILAQDFYQAKAKYALAKAREIIANQYETTVEPHHVYLIDDYPEVCNGCTELGYSSVCVHHLADATLMQQKQVIEMIFNKILPRQLQNYQSLKNAQENLLSTNQQVLNLLPRSSSALEKMPELKKAIKSETVAQPQVLPVSLTLLPPPVLPPASKEEEKSQSSATPTSPLATLNRAIQQWRQK